MILAFIDNSIFIQSKIDIAKFKNFLPVLVQSNYKFEL